MPDVPKEGCTHLPQGKGPLCLHPSAAAVHCLHSTFLNACLHADALTLQVLRSAQANAVNNHGLDGSRLSVGKRACALVQLSSLLALGSLHYHSAVRSYLNPKGGRAPKQVLYLLMGGWLMSCRPDTCGARVPPEKVMAPRPRQIWHPAIVPLTSHGASSYAWVFNMIRRVVLCSSQVLLSCSAVHTLTICNCCVQVVLRESQVPRFTQFQMPVMERQRRFV